MPPEACPAGFNGILVPPGTPVLLGEGGKSNRRRVQLNPASELFDTALFGHAAAGRRERARQDASLSPLPALLTPQGRRLRRQGAFGIRTGTSTATELVRPVSSVTVSVTV